MNLCPLCYRGLDAPGHTRWFDGDLTCCEQGILAATYPRDPETQEPLLPHLAYVNDVWMFGVTCVHVMRGGSAQLARLQAFRRRWPVGGALLFEDNPTEALLAHYQPMGLARLRADLTWRIADCGICAYTPYLVEALLVLHELDLETPAGNAPVEAWRRWRLWTMGVTA